MGEDAVVSGGLTRRDLMKGAAVAGTLAWAAPVLQTSTAWADVISGPACNDCNGLTLYSKYAPGASNTTGNQCLSPCAPVDVIAFSTLVCNGLVTVDESVHTNDDVAGVAFSNKVRLIRTAIKTESDCLIATCADGFANVYQNATSTNPPCNHEIDGLTAIDPVSPPLFALYETSTPPNPADCGPLATPTACTQTVSEVVYNTNGFNQKLNYIEIILCLSNTSKLPQACS